jgi:excisionase family DNA binding protein
MPMTRGFEPAMTVKDVAAYLNVDEKTIYRLVQRGVLPGFKVAGAWRFQRADIQRWIEVQKPGTAQ